MTLADSRPVQENVLSTAANCHSKAIELAGLSLRMTTAAGSGHPSTAMALAHIVTELMYRRMHFDPADPWNPGNDRLVLSIGHAVPIVYAAYADLGGAVGTDRNSSSRLSIEDVDQLRELSSVLDGHPNPAEGFPFFDAATGSLGQGLSVAAGLAAASRLDGIDKRIYVICGDGEAREGQVWEAADFIVDHKLTNVCAVFSCNGHGQAAPVSSQQSSDALAAKMAAFGWHVVEVDGHDPDALHEAFEPVENASKPTAIIARTVKGWGVDSMQQSNFHGKPIAADQLANVLAELQATGEQLGANGELGERPEARRRAIPSKKSGKVLLPPLKEALQRVGLSAAFDAKKLATRRAYGAALVALGDADDRIVSLDGDVGNSTFANMFEKAHPNRFFECKIAEQNMISVGAGLAATGKVPFASSFAKFIARGTDQIDMAGISRANLKIVGSHSGVSLGADGPSQMSVSDMAYFRSMTRVDDGCGNTLCHVFHPSDAVCTYRCVELMANVPGLCYLRTHRPDAPFIYPVDEAFELRGCKQLREGSSLTLVSSGFMLHTVLDAAEQLANDGIQCNVFDAYTLPMDATPILTAAQNAGRTILTAEDNYEGGVHAELAEAAAATGNIRVVGLAVNRVPKSAKSADEVFDFVGVGKGRIIEKAHELATM